MKVMNASVVSACSFVNDKTFPRRFGRKNRGSWCEDNICESRCIRLLLGACSFIYYNHLATGRLGTTASLLSGTEKGSSWAKFTCHFQCGSEIALSIPSPAVGGKLWPYKSQTVDWAQGRDGNGKWSHSLRPAVFDGQGFTVGWRWSNGCNTLIYSSCKIDRKQNGNLLWSVLFFIIRETLSSVSLYSV